MNGEPSVGSGAIDRVPVDLVSVVTSDGLRLHGAFHSPNATDSPTDSPVDAVVMLHGVGSNFYSGRLFPPLIRSFCCSGMAVVNGNLRGHDGFYNAMVGDRPQRLGAAYECVDDCVRDVAAWVSLLVALGYRRVALVAHSLGAIKAIYSQAMSPLPEVTSLIALSAPRLSYDVFAQSALSEDFLADYQVASHFVESGEPHTLIESRVPFPMLITAGAFVDKYGPANRYDVLQHARGLDCRALLLYGELELDSQSDAFRDVPAHLLEIAAKKSNMDVELVSGADHFYTGKSSLLADSLNSWLMDKNRL